MRRLAWMAGVVIVVVIGYITMVPDRNSDIPDCRYPFPLAENVYMVQSSEVLDRRSPPKLVVKEYRINKPPRTPVEDPGGSGEWLWDVFECMNVDCPFYRENGRRLKFSNFDPGWLDWAKKGFPEPPGTTKQDGLSVDPAGLMGFTRYPPCPVCQSPDDAPERVMTEKEKARIKEILEIIAREEEMREKP